MELLILLVLGLEFASSGGGDWPWSFAKIDDEISQAATKPFAQPTASSVPDSQVRQVQMVLGGRDSKAPLSYRTFQQSVARACIMHGKCLP